MQSVIRSFVRYLSSQDIIKAEDEDLYQYGLWSGFLYVVNIAASLSILIIMDAFIYGALFLVLFMAYRSYAGGYHHKSPLVCFFLSQGSLILDILFIRWLFRMITPENSFWVIAVYLISCIPVIMLAPQQAPENPLSDKEVKRCRRIVAILTICVSLAAILTAVWQNYNLLSLAAVLNATILMSYAAYSIKCIIKAG